MHRPCVARRVSGWEGVATLTLPLEFDGSSTVATVARHLRAARRLRLALPSGLGDEAVARLLDGLRRRPGVLELRDGSTRASLIALSNAWLAFTP